VRIAIISQPVTLGRDKVLAIRQPRAFLVASRGLGVPRGGTSFSFGDSSRRPLADAARSLVGTPQLRVGPFDGGLRAFNGGLGLGHVYGLIEVTQGQAL
jgi:hypothetical protein